MLGPSHPQNCIELDVMSIIPALRRQAGHKFQVVLEYTGVQSQPEPQQTLEEGCGKKRDLTPGHDRHPALAQEILVTPKCSMPFHLTDLPSSFHLENSTYFFKTSQMSSLPRHLVWGCSSSSLLSRGDISSSGLSHTGILYHFM